MPAQLQTLTMRALLGSTLGCRLPWRLSAHLALVRYVQRTLQGPVELVVISASSSKRETNTEHAMMGYMTVIRSSTSPDSA